FRRDEMPAPAPATPSSPPPAIATAPEKPRWRAALGASLASSLGALPGVALGATVRGLLRPPRLLPFEVWATLFPRARAALPDGGADLWSWRVGAAPCLATDRGRLAAGACAGVEAGALGTTGFVFAADRSSQTTMV